MILTIGHDILGPVWVVLQEWHSADEVHAGAEHHKHRPPVAVADQPRAHLIPAAHGAARWNAGVVGMAEPHLAAGPAGDALSDRRAAVLLERGRVEHAIADRIALLALEDALPDPLGMKLSTFCPKAIAGKGTKAPDTIMSRAILITQKRRTRDEPIAHFNYVDDDGFIRLRGRLARWAADNGEALGLARPAMPEGFLNRTASNWQLLFAMADSLGEEAGKRARKAAEQIVGITDLISAGVELLHDIKTMFARSTVEYLTSKAIVADLTADPEKRWAEWSRGKPITEKGVATLLHEFRIFSRDVGPRDERVKGYRKADFADVWERYVDNEKKAPRSDPDNFPRTRAPFCSHSDFDEKSAAHQTFGAGQEIGNTLSNINAVSGCAGKTAKIDLSPDSSAPEPDPWADLDIPDFLRREVPPDRRPALGPVGDSLDDLEAPFGPALHERR
jgi:hypothetical protein